MAINVSVQYYGGFLPDTTLLTQGYLLPLGDPFKYHVESLSISLLPCVMLYYIASVLYLFFCLVSLHGD